MPIVIEGDVWEVYGYNHVVKNIREGGEGLVCEMWAEGEGRIVSSYPISNFTSKNHKLVKRAVMENV